jgi:glutamine synthetase
VLLRSAAALRREALRLFSVMGDDSHKSIHTDSGLEQEFFLIDRSFYLRRPDVMVTGRTLIGSPPPKGQELEDQYFGHKSERFLDAIHAFEVEMWKLGVPIMTRHREVAPGQYEVAPRFALANVATDRNLIAMEVLKKTARKHGLAALLHEKPFRGVNGSGKHNNWSFGTNKLPSVLTPGTV